jgi:uncharacterized protein
MKKPVGRRLLEELRKALGQFPAVVIVGARQTGKSTLARAVEEGGRRYFTFDDLSVLSAAQRDPSGFVRGLEGPATLDEVQRVPGLLLAVKKEIDRDRAPGRFLLTGSATLGPFDRTGETLAGRAAVLRLRPLTGSELDGNPEWNPLEALLKARDRDEILSAFVRKKAPALHREALLRGGFPEPALGLGPGERSSWFEQYRRTYVERDVPRLVAIAEVPAFTAFVALVAEETAHVLNLSSVAREIGISVDTCRRWIGVLQATFLVDALPAFARSARSRLARSPKLHWTDTGLCAHLAGVRDVGELERRNLAGALTESLVFSHLASFAEGLTGSCRLYHYRTYGGAEADMVLEGRGRWVPVEVKAGATVSKGDAKGLEAFLDEHPQKAPFGILLYNGDEAIPLSRRAAAIPLGAFLAGR